MKMKQNNTIYFSIVFLLLISLCSIVSSEFIVSQVNLTQTNLSNNYSITNVDLNNFEIKYTDNKDNFIVGLTNPELNICKCETKSSFVIISNTGNLASSYHIDSNKDYVVLSEENVFIQAGQSKTIQIQYIAPCTKFFSSDTLKLTINSINGKSKQISQKIKFNSCQNLAVSFSKKENLTINPCENQVFDLTIFNTGSFKDTYDIYVNNELKPYTTFDYNNILLEPNSNVNIKVHLATACELYGDYDLELTIKSRKNSKTTTIVQPITITKNYLFNAKFNSDAFFVCSGENLTGGLIIENLNTFENQFRFSTKAPSFVSFDFPKNSNNVTEKSITLSGESTTIVPIQIETDEFDEGNYQIIVKTNSLNGNINQEITIPLQVENCYDFSMDVVPNKLYFCGQDDRSQPIQITNKGTKNTTIELVYEGPNFAHVNEEVTTILGNDVENTKELIFTNVMSANEIYPSKLKIYHQGEFQTEKKLTLVTYSTEKCYNVVLKKDSIKLLPYDELDFSLVLKNNGLRNGEYFLNLTDAPEYLSLLSKTISLNTSTSSSIHFQINESELQEYSDAFNNGSSIGIIIEPTLKIIHIETGTELNYPLNIEFVDLPFYQKAWIVISNFTVSIWNYLYSLSTCVLSLLILTLLAFAFFVAFVTKLILKSRREYRFKPSKYFILILIALFIIASIFIFTYKEFPLNLPLELDKPLSINMYENSVENLNMNDYFADEDNDITNYYLGFNENNANLTYNFNQTNLELISTDVEQKTNSSFVLTAVDSYFETASSEEILVNVYPLKEFFSNNDKFIAFCPYLNLTMLFIFFVFLCLTFTLRKLTAKEKKQLEQQKQREEKQRLKEIAKEKQLKEKLKEQKKSQSQNKTSRK